MMTEHHRSFKPGISSSKNRRRRNDTNLQIRKNRRAEGIARRRAIVCTSSSSGNVGAAAAAPDSVKRSNTFGSVLGPGCNADMDGVSSALPPLLQKIFQNAQLPEAVIKLLTRNDSGIGAGTNNSNLDFSCAKTAANATDFKTLVVECGCVPILVSILKRGQDGAREGAGGVGSANDSYEKDEVRGQSALCLGNIAGETSALREYVLKCDAMNALLQNLPCKNDVDEDADTIMHSMKGNDIGATNTSTTTKMTINGSLVENIVWSISNLCRGRKKPLPDYVSIAIPYLFQLVQSSGIPRDVQLNACWALAYMTDGSHELIMQSLQDAGILRHTTSILRREVQQHVNPSLVLSVLRILCNYVYGSDTTQSDDDDDERSCNILNFLDNFFTSDQVENISHLLRTSTKDVMMEACFFLSNIIEIGREKYASIMIQSTTLMQTLIDLIQNAPMSIKVEALWVIWGIIEVAKEEEVRTLVEQLGIISALFSHQMNMDFVDSKTIIMVLDSIDTILLVGERSGQDYRTYVHECGGFDIIEGLQTHTSDEVYRRAVEIRDAYFGVDDEDEDEEEYYNQFY